MLRPVEQPEQARKRPRGWALLPPALLVGLLGWALVGLELPLGATTLRTSATFSTQLRFAAESIPAYRITGSGQLLSPYGFEAAVSRPGAGGCSLTLGPCCFNVFWFRPHF